MSSICEKIEEEISALVDNELSGREQRRVAAHVVACPRCSELVGQLLATKRLLAAGPQPVEPPAHGWGRVAMALDAVDGLARASVPARRIPRWGTAPALAAVGLVLIAAALVWRARVMPSEGTGALFARAHLIACSRLNWDSALPNTRDVVTPRPFGTQWVPAARALLRVNGEFVDHTLYRVDRTPISEFVLPARSFNPAGLSRVRVEGANYWVRAERGGTIVAWESAGIVHVLVGRTGAEELVGLAVARRAQIPLTSSM